MTLRDTRLPKALGDDLFLRHATVDDVDALAEFNARVHSSRGWEQGCKQPDEAVGIWVHDMMSGRHPTMQSSDFLPAGAFWIPVPG